MSSYSVAKSSAVYILIQCTECEILLMLTPITKTYFVSFWSFCTIQNAHTNEQIDWLKGKSTVKMGWISTIPTEPDVCSRLHAIYIFFVYSHTIYNYPISTSANKMNSFKLYHDNSSFASQHPTHHRSCICLFTFFVFECELNVHILYLIVGRNGFFFFSHVTNVTALGWCCCYSFKQR